MARNRTVHTIIGLLNGILPILFWMSLIFGFEENGMAIATVAAALIHESGHYLYITFVGGKAGLRGVISGFRIKTDGILSYQKEMMLYMWGPLSNILASVLLLVPCIAFGGVFQKLITANIITALSNLLPIKGYDGYGVIRSIIMKNDCLDLMEGALSIISSVLIFSLCMLSLYFIDRFGGGYWIFAVFFISMIKELSNRLQNSKIEN